MKQMLVTSSKWLLDGQRYLHLVSEGILANTQSGDHHDGDAVVMRQCARMSHNSISKDSNYTTSPLKPIIVLKGLYG